MNNVKNNKGFTLAELLIVIAIIAALVAIMIPTFSGQIEKAREATDMANLRAAYAEVTNRFLENKTGTDLTITVTATQKQDGWQSVDSGKQVDIGNVKNVSASTTSWTVEWDTTNGAVKIS